MSNKDNYTQTETNHTTHPYDYPFMVKYVSKQGKDLFGRDFVIDDNDLPVVNSLLVYFLRDESVAPAAGIDLNKGILLMGPVGCGKTSLLRIMSLLCPAVYKPSFHSCNEIVIEFNTKGFEAILPYTKGSFLSYTSIPRIHCFDDLGLEPRGSYFGTPCNVIAEILLSRYNYFTTRRMITHVTTNLNTGELESIYGDRLRSRMREMFNLITFDNNSTDKRK